MRHAINSVYIHATHVKSQNDMWEIARTWYHRLSHLILNWAKSNVRTFWRKWATRQLLWTSGTLPAKIATGDVSTGLTAPATGRHRGVCQTFFPPSDTFNGRVTRWHKMARHYVAVVRVRMSRRVSVSIHLAAGNAASTKHFRPDEIYGSIWWSRCARIR